MVGASIASGSHTWRGNWCGDDGYNGYSPDPSGTGHLIGNDAEIYFNMYMNDNDDDYIPYWTEVSSYPTILDPTRPDYDVNNDKIPDWWERKMWMDLETNNANGDYDSDGLTNVEEFYLDKPVPTSPITTSTFVSPSQAIYMGDPWTKDIFVEVDWMGGCVYYGDHRMRTDAVNKVITVFAQHGIILHIDDGNMGGGTIVSPHNYNVGLENGGTFYTVYKSNNFATTRNGIFYYCLFVHRICMNGADSTGWAEDIPGDDFGIGDDNIRSVVYPLRPFDSPEFLQAVVFMHELGHALGLLHIDSNDNVPDNPNEAKSAMWTTENWIQMITQTLYLDYHQNEWAALNFAGLNDGD
ncbi:MAG: hypothetical protein WC974_01325 [Thermoplasmata archaeon]